MNRLVFLLVLIVLSQGKSYAWRSPTWYNPYLVRGVMNFQGNNSFGFSSFVFSGPNIQKPIRFHFIGVEYYLQDKELGLNYVFSLFKSEFQYTGDRFLVSRSASEWNDEGELDIKKEKVFESFDVTPVVGVEVTNRRIKGVGGMMFKVSNFMFLSLLYEKETFRYLENRNLSQYFKVKVDLKIINHEGVHRYANY